MWIGPRLQSIEHEYRHRGQFFILDQALIEQDVTTLEFGDCSTYVSARHNSHGELGSLLTDIDHGIF